MSITDDTTGLDQSWAEDTVVAFTAGTLNTVTDMVTEVESKLKRGTLSTSSSPALASVQRWLVRAKEELMQVKSFSFARRFAYATLTAGDYRIALPPDYAGGHVVLLDQNNDRNIKIWPNHIFDLKYPDMDEEGDDEPIVATIKGRELWISPPVSAGIRLEIQYDRSGDDNTPTDFSFLPEIERFGCCDYALSEAAESLEDWNKAKWYKGKWNDRVGRSRRADARRKWKNIGFRAISCFEEIGARTYQQGR